MLTSVIDARWMRGIVATPAHPPNSPSPCASHCYPKTCWFVRPGRKGISKARQVSELRRHAWEYINNACCLSFNLDTHVPIKDPFIAIYPGMAIILPSDLETNPQPVKPVSRPELHSSLSMTVYISPVVCESSYTSCVYWDSAYIFCVDGDSAYIYAVDCGSW